MPLRVPGAGAASQGGAQGRAVRVGPLEATQRKRATLLRLGSARTECHYLHPGKIFASARACGIKTILGSCVAVALWDSTSGVGGLNHFLLPEPFGTPASGTAMRFGVYAVRMLVEELEALGAKRRRLQAKLFGGAALAGGSSGPKFSIGARNVTVARTVLAELGIPVICEDVGGDRGRKLIFDVASGEAEVWLL